MRPIVLWRVLKDDVIADRLDSSTFGLSAIKAKADENQTDLDTALARLGAGLDTESAATKLDRALTRLGAGLDTTDASTKLDNIYTRIGVPAGTDISADIAKNLSEIGIVKARLGTPPTDIKTMLDDITSRVTGIQNNTRFTAPDLGIMQRPATAGASQAYIITANLYDTEGNMEDPDGNELDLQVTNTAGVDRSAKLYQDANLTTPAADADTAAGYVGKKMVRVSTGRYEAYYWVDNTDAEEGLRFHFNYKEGGVLKHQDRVGQVSDATNDLNQIRIVVEHATYGNAQLRTELDNIDAELANGTYGLAALNTDLDTLLTRIGTPATSLKQDHDDIVTQLGTSADGATTLGSHFAMLKWLEGELIAETDAIDAELANATYGLSALNSDLDSILSRIGAPATSLKQDHDDIKTQLGTSADAASMTASHFAALKDIHDDLAAVGAKVGTQLQQIEWMPVVGTAGGTDILNDDPTEFFEEGSTSSTTDAEIWRQTIDAPEAETKTVRGADLTLTVQGSVSAGSGDFTWQVGSGSSPTSWVNISDVVGLSTTELSYSRSGKLKISPEMDTLPFTIRLVAKVSSSLDTATIKVSSRTGGLIEYSI